MAKRTIEHVEVAGQRVLTRVDFNVPLDDTGAIVDDRRIRMALPTIRSIIDRGGRAVVMSHLGRPKGIGREPALSLAPTADRLRELLDGAVVEFPGDDCIGAAADAAVSAMGDGSVVVLENLRFHAGEKSGDEAFAARLAAFGDVYCNDAFGTAHRSDASMVAVPGAMMDRPRVAGMLLEKELAYLADTIANAERPFVAVLGGAKVSDKLGALRHLAGRVDTILVGGAMAYTFLAARGIATGSSLVEAAMVEEAREMLEAAAGGSTSIRLPDDHVVARAIDSSAETRTLIGAIDQGWMGLDIGPATVASYAAILANARTIVWNGPMGVFETPPFDAGTLGVARALAEATAGGAVSVVGGGDSAAAIEAAGLADRISHISTGGGASLAMLEGRRFASVDALEDGPPA